MTDAIVWMDKLPDIIKKWILIIPMVIAAIGGGSGIYQYFDKQSVMKTAEKEKNKAIHEVATAFQNIIEPEPKAPIKVYKTDCGICTKLMEKHEKRLH